VINAVHLLIYSQDAGADRAFLRDVLGYASVESPGPEPGWRIFKLPPAELGVHPTDGPPVHELHFMCDDIEATVAELAAKGVATTGRISDVGYGKATAIRLPSGAEVGLYEPHHPTAYDL
jgi:predicted enzyme related to lactoylglutathione lyase